MELLLFVLCGMAAMFTVGYAIGHEVASNKLERVYFNDMIERGK